MVEDPDCIATRFHEEAFELQHFRAAWSSTGSCADNCAKWLIHPAHPVWHGMNISWLMHLGVALNKISAEWLRSIYRSLVSLKFPSRG